jgi:hypothetical protein
MDMAQIQLLVSIHKDQTAVVNTLWHIYQAISLAMLGYVFSQEHVRKNAVILSCLSAGFAFVAIANQRAILRSQELIYTAAMQLKALASNHAAELEHLRAVLISYETVSPATLQLGHYAFTALVLVGIWAPFISSRYPRPLTRRCTRMRRKRRAGKLFG